MHTALLQYICALVMNTCFALQVFDGVAVSYKNYFDPGPEGRQMQDLIPTTKSFKIVAETPIQGKHCCRTFSPYAS